MKKIFWFAAFLFVCLLFAACAGDDDDNDPSPDDDDEIIFDDDTMPDCPGDSWPCDNGYCEDSEEFSFVCIDGCCLPVGPIPILEK